MARAITTGEMLDLIADSLRTGGREVERTLQVAAGAAFLAILATLSSTWTSLDEPLGALRIAYIRAMAAVAVVFCFAVFATIVRLILEWDLIVAEKMKGTETARYKAVMRLTRLVICATWALMICISVVHGYQFGRDLLSELTAASGREVQVMKMKVEEIDRRLDALEEAGKIR